MRVERTGVVKGTRPASTSHCPTTRFSPFAVVSSGRHEMRVPGWPEGSAQPHPTNGVTVRGQAARAWLSKATTRLAAQKQSHLQANNIHVLHDSSLRQLHRDL